MIAIDNSAGLGTSASNSITASYTCSGTNRLLTVWVAEFSNAGQASQITGVTYNSVALTKIGSTITVPGQNYYLSAWYLLNPASGANNITVSLTSANNIFFDTIAASYKGVLQLTPLDVNNSGTASAVATQALNVTTTTANDWVLGAVQGLSQTQSAGASTTKRRASAANQNFNLFDSNVAVAIGSNNLNVTFGANETEAWIAAAFKPAPDTGGAFLLNMV